MTSSAVDEFAEHLRQSRSPAATDLSSLELLRSYFQTLSTNRITPDCLRQLLSRWFIETATGASPDRLIKLLELFFNWVEQPRLDAPREQFFEILAELSQSLPRAIQITEALSKQLADRGGAFSFPEFLTTFAEGGQSRYDIDVAGEGEGPGALEGYFRVVDIEGGSVEVEDLITEQRIGPVVFPESVAVLLQPGFIINLELIRSEQGWQVAACGYVYPPGTTLE